MFILKSTVCFLVEFCLTDFVFSIMFLAVIAALCGNVRLLVGSLAGPLVGPMVGLLVGPWLVEQFLKLKFQFSGDKCLVIYKE